jgi:hypothetical protein
VAHLVRLAPFEHELLRDAAALPSPAMIASVIPLDNLSRPGAHGNGLRLARGQLPAIFLHRARQLVARCRATAASRGVRLLGYCGQITTHRRGSQSVNLEIVL